MAIKSKDRKKLWALSGNRCAICRCELVIKSNISESENIVGEECHIKSKKERGPRYSESDNEALDSYQNIILLCCTHHTIIDNNRIEYSVERLKEIKYEHENWVRNSLRAFDRFESVDSLKDCKEQIEDILFSKLKAEKGQLSHIEAFSFLFQLINKKEYYDEIIINQIWDLIHAVTIKYVQNEWETYSTTSIPEYRISDLSPYHGLVSLWEYDLSYIKTQKIAVEVSEMLAKRGLGISANRKGFFKRIFVDQNREMGDDKAIQFYNLLVNQLKSRIQLFVTPASELPEDLRSNLIEFSIIGNEFAYTFQHNEYTHYITRLDSTSDALDCYSMLEKYSIPGNEYALNLKRMIKEETCQ